MSKSQTPHVPGARRSRVPVLLAVLAVGPVASAAPPLTQLTLPDAIGLAIRNNPDSRSTDADIAVARGALRQAAVLPNPSIFLYTLGANISPADAPWPESVRPHLDHPRRRPARRRDAGGARRHRQPPRPTRPPRTASWRSPSRPPSSTCSSISRCSTSPARIRRRSASRWPSTSCATRTARSPTATCSSCCIQERAVDDTVRQAQQSLVNDRAELGRLVGPSALAPEFQVAGTLAPPTERPLPDVAAVIDGALRDRPEFRSLHAQLDGAVAAISAARRQAIPDRRRPGRLRPRPRHRRPIRLRADGHRADLRLEPGQRRPGARGRGQGRAGRREPAQPGARRRRRAPSNSGAPARSGCAPTARTSSRRPRNRSTSPAAPTRRGAGPCSTSSTPSRATATSSAPTDRPRPRRCSPPPT